MYDHQFDSFVLFSFKISEFTYFLYDSSCYECRLKSLPQSY